MPDFEFDDEYVEGYGAMFLEKLREASDANVESDRPLSRDYIYGAAALMVVQEVLELIVPELGITEEEGPKDEDE